MHLSVKEKRKLKKEKKSAEYKDALAKETGIYFSDEISAKKEGIPYLKYILNALILFASVYGCASCIVSAFSIKVTMYPLLVTCIAASLILSFMYLNQKAKIVTYLALLVLFVYSAFRYFSLINSGVSGLRNNILKYIDKHVSLPFLREFTLTYSDEYVAMSIALCFIAVALMILINIVVSEKMSLRGVFLLTFPFIQFGMYFNFSSSKLSMLLVMVSWILVAGINFNNGYNGLTSKMISKSSVKNHRHSYGFVTDSKNIANIAAVWLCFASVVTGLVFFAVPNNNYEVDMPTNGIKTSTERIVKNFLSYGLSTMYSVDRSSSEPGSLANVSTIAFDGLANLKVTLVDYGAERIYLRNFSGYQYDGKSMKWYPEKSAYDREKMYNYTAQLLKTILKPNSR